MRVSKHTCLQAGRLKSKVQQCLAFFVHAANNNFNYSYNNKICLLWDVEI